MKMRMEYPCVYFEKNGKCRKFSDDFVASYCVLGPCPEQTLSNADRIREMSDEELAKFIATPCQCEVGPKRDGFRECGNDLCLQYLLKWLRQPAEEDT